MEKQLGFTTELLHSDRKGTIEHGSLHKPIHTSIAYGYEKAEDLAAVFQNRQKGYAYSRQANPTVSALEDKVTLLEQGVGTVCFSTGMAAIAGVLATLLRRGDHVVSSAFLFGNTASQLNTFQSLGLEVTFVDATEARNVEAALRPETRAVLVETIANPVTQLADFVGIGALCTARKIMYVIDNTLTTPYLFYPKSVGATFSVNSLSKHFGGHGDALGGAVTDLGTFDWSNYPHIYDVYKNGHPSRFALTQIRKKGLRDFGATLAPEAAHTLSIGSDTLALRMDRCCSNAVSLAEALAKHPKVKRVNHPSLLSHPQHARAAHLFTRFGALLSFEVADGLDPLATLNRLRIAIISSNLGDNRTLVIPVSHTIFFEMGPDRRRAMGIDEGLIRVSVGIEDNADLIGDFKQALDQA